MHDIEEVFKHFLQRNIVFSLDSKIIKEGSLILYKQNDYYFSLYLKNGNQDQKKFEIPYPFSIERKNNYFVLNYTMSSISKGDNELYYKLMCLNQNSKSRFYNSKLILFEKNTLDLSVVV